MLILTGRFFDKSCLTFDKRCLWSCNRYEVQRVWRNYMLYLWVNRKIQKWIPVTKESPWQDPPRTGTTSCTARQCCTQFLTVIFILSDFCACQSAGRPCKTWSRPRRPIFPHVLSFECTLELCINFLNHFTVYSHI